jgi:hypothetical protein
MTTDQIKKLHTIKELLSCSNSDSLNINQWERNFIESLKDGYDLSEKQVDKLDKIYEKI